MRKEEKLIDVSRGGEKIRQQGTSVECILPITDLGAQQISKLYNKFTVYNKCG